LLLAWDQPALPLARVCGEGTWTSSFSGSRKIPRTYSPGRGDRPSYPAFLEANEIQRAGVLPTKIDPTMFFAGFRKPVTGLLREISKEAKKIASDIAEHRSP
jgi:hypothetical protein